ncbi:MAG: Nif3-like dinuclear metal center hexameric protein [Ruminococcaceae bacterium]|jgi:dinuclear metal center YbgI/SA1388 family protein|nr:Nif3-like dinuclear metal center hexameric protein [Oscillospiraceae bacterium]
MTTVRDIERMLFTWAPRELAEEWDNVGLLVGDPDIPVRRILVALDITEAVVAEAAEQGAELIVAHHPVMNCTWHRVQTVRADDRQGRILTALIQQGIAVICMHTNLDAAEGGVNDMLAHRLGLTDLIPLSVEKIGRVGTLNSEIPLVEFTRSVVKLLRANGLRYTDRGRPVQRVAVGGGACGDYIRQAVEMGCDTFVTSDLKYHDFLDTTEINLIDAGHFPTEDLICTELVRRISAAFPGVTSVKTAAHCREIIQYCIKES